MKPVTITNVKQLVEIIDWALDDRNVSDSEVQKRAGLSNAYLYAARNGSGNMSTKSLLALLDVLQLRLTISDPYDVPEEPKKPAPLPPSFIEDIRVDQSYGWVQDPQNLDELVWGPTNYKVMIKRGDQWEPMQINHLNRNPPKMDTRS